MKESPLFWPAVLKNDGLNVLDETLIPEKIRYIRVKNVDGAVKVIREMKTRAFGQFLVVLNAFLLEIRLMDQKQLSEAKKLARIQEVAQKLNKSRPTFPFSEVTGIVARWAVMAIDSKLKISPFVKRNTEGYLESIRGKRLDRVNRIAAIIQDQDRILTHCNVSGELAMAAAICKTDKKNVSIFATETRPYFQGAKLTAWELGLLGADVTLVADNAVAALMADGKVNKVIVGSDRSCANGDFANKIGTYQIAVLARQFGIPFHVLTQPSDKIRSLRDIPVEIRHKDELLKFEGRKTIRGKCGAFYPGFDVIPHDLITSAIAIGVKENE
ncbi:MAG: hypothetical protein HQL23_06595 [Candidatus Omnitrophica bacterium]|nr:hypothetical protein [Candidatus Omnitrophota bacterium]